MRKNDIDKFIYVEDNEIYNGWICMYRPSDGKIIWRDYIVYWKGISDEFKTKMKKDLDKYYENL